MTARDSWADLPIRRRSLTAKAKRAGPKAQTQASVKICRCTAQHQDALLLVLHSALQVDTVGPRIGGPPGPQITLPPTIKVGLPLVFQTGERLRRPRSGDVPGSSPPRNVIPISHPVTHFRT